MLKQVRAGNRAYVTKLLTKFEELKNGERDIIELEDVLAIQNGIQEKQDVLKKLNNQVIEAMSENGNVVQEITESEEYMFDLDGKLRQIRKFIQKLKSNSDTPHKPQVQTGLDINAQSFTPAYVPMHNINTSATNPREGPSCNMTYENNVENLNTHNMFSPTEPESRPTPQIANSYHRLPKLDFPKFDGNVLQWTTFWDSYESAIHYNTSLTPVQKFSYLKAQLLGIAAQTIGGFTLNNVNYDAAVKLLKERFGSPQKIINAHMKALNDLPAPTNELHSLRSFSDYLETYIRGLEGLGQLQEMYGSLLVPVLISKLPVEIRRNIAREQDSDTVTLSALRKAIIKEVRVLDAGEFTDNDGLYSTSTFFAGAKRHHEKQHYHPKTNTQSHTNYKRETKTKPCIYCGESHFSSDCKKKTDVIERIDILKQKRVCFNCLGDHRVSECKSKNRCKKCHKKHHTSICSDKHSNEKRQDKTETSVNLVNTDEETKTTVMHTAQQRTNVKKAIAPITYRKQTSDVNILFDEGSQRSFISKKLTDKLNIESTGKDTIELSAFGDTSKNVRHLETTIIYLNTDSGEKLAIRALIVPDIAVPLQNQMDYVPKNLPYLRNVRLAHPCTQHSCFEIELLIGADYYWDIVQDHIIRGDGPTAISSKIGYLLSGPVNNSRQSTQRSSVLLNMITNKEEEANIEKFWNLESIGIHSAGYDEDETFLKTYQQSAIKFENGQYSAKLPWKQDHPELPSNYSIAKARTENVIRRLSKQPHLLDKYTEILKDQEKRGFIEKVDEEKDKATTTHYIPHHAVKKESTTTPIRIVYDCSCKQSADHASLNDCLMPVPPDLNDLTKILMRFRLGNYAISTDIEKAFLHVRLDEKDRDYTRFFWLSNPKDPNSNLMTYRFKAVLFGATCSPFILQATLMKHLSNQNTEVSTKMGQDLYVDNVLSSLDTETNAINYFSEARAMMLDAGFNLRSWSSNSSKVRELATTQNVLERDSTVKILGLKWDTEQDTITLQKVKLSEMSIVNVTKREILRQSSRIYDPLGLLSPVTVRAKLLIQTLWNQNYEWDELLQTEIQNTWKELSIDFETITQTELKRQYFQQVSGKKNLNYMYLLMLV